MICFGIYPCRPTASVAHEERGLQLKSISFVQVEIFQELCPHASPGLSVVVSSCGHEEDYGKVEVAEDRAEFALES